MPGDVMRLRLAGLREYLKPLRPGCCGANEGSRLRPAGFRHLIEGAGCSVGRCRFLTPDGWADYSRRTVRGPTRWRPSMKCPRCQHENPTTSGFCLECGARLGLTCASCGTDLPAGSKFCNKCGTAVSGPTAGQPRL